jgi:SOS-response transcriptional repressor LexA
VTRTDRVLKVVEEFWRAHRTAPSVRDVMVRAGLRSSSASAYHLGRLVDQGRLEIVGMADPEIGIPGFRVRHYAPPRARCLELLATPLLY